MELLVHALGVIVGGILGFKWASLLTRRLDVLDVLSVEEAIARHSKASAAYVGDQKVSRVYLGTRLIRDYEDLSV